MPKVIKNFIDKLSLKEFKPGDVYPPAGLEVSEERIAELSHKGYITDEEIKVEEKPKKRSSRKKES